MKSVNHSADKSPVLFLLSQPVNFVESHTQDCEQGNAHNPDESGNNRKPKHPILRSGAVQPKVRIQKPAIPDFSAAEGLHRRQRRGREDQEEKRKDVVPARVLRLSKIIAGSNALIPTVFIPFSDIDPTLNPPRHSNRHSHQKDNEEGEQSADG